MTYLRLVPVASRNAAGVSGARRRPSRGPSQRGRGTSSSRRRGRLEADDPAAALQRADPVRRAGGGAGRLRQRRRRRDRERGVRAGPSPQRAPDRRPASRRPRPADDRPSRRARPVARRGDRRRRRAIGSTAVRLDAGRRGAASRAGRAQPRPGDRRRSSRRPRRAPRSAAAASDVGGERRRTHDAVQVQPAAAARPPDRRRRPRRRAPRPGPPSHGAARRPAAAAASSTTRRRRPRRADGRRSTNRSPGATAIGAVRRRIAATVPSGRSTRLAAAPPDRARRPPASCRGGGAAARPVAGERRREADEEPVVATTAGSSVRTSAARSAVGIDAGEVERRPARAGARDRRAVDLDLADPHRDRSPGTSRSVAAADQRRAAQRAGDDGAATPDREDPVDREPRPPVARDRVARRPRVPQRDRAPPGAPSMPSPRRRRDGQDRRAGQRRPASSRRRAVDHLRRPAPAPTRSAFVTTATPVADPERVEQREVLDGLGPRPVVGGDDQQRGVDLARPDEHVADQPVVPRDVDEVELGAVGSARWAYPTSIVIPRRRSSGSRSASIPVSARSSVVLPWSMWPAVPTTTVIGGPGRRQGSRDGPGRGRRRRRARPSAGRARPGPVLDPADDRRLAGPQARGQRHRRPAPARHQPDRRAASRPAATRRRWPTPSRSTTTRAGRVGQSAPRARRPARRAPPGGTAIIRQTGMSVDGPARLGTARASRPRRRGSPCPAASRAPAGRCRSRAIRSARPTTSPACGPPTSLSPLNVTMSAPAASRSPGVGSWASPKRRGVEQRAAAEVVDDDRAVPRGRCAASSVASGASTNPACAKFDGWTRRTTVARPRPSGASKSAARVRFVVPTSISRAPARRTISGIRTPPPISTSSPRDTTTPAPPGQPDRQGEGRGVVVGDQRVLGAGQRDEVLLGGAGSEAPAGRPHDRARGASSRPRRASRPRWPPTARAPVRGSCGG